MTSDDAGQGCYDARLLRGQGTHTSTANALLQGVSALDICFTSTSLLPYTRTLATEQTPNHHA